MYDPLILGPVGVWHVVRPWVGCSVNSLEASAFGSKSPRQWQVMRPAGFALASLGFLSHIPDNYKEGHRP